MGMGRGLEQQGAPARPDEHYKFLTKQSPSLHLTDVEEAYREH